MSAAARRSRVPPVQLDTVEKPRAGIGHNGGPPLDNSGSVFLWRRAVKRAWKTLPREIALARLRQADALGLSYRDYTAVLMDRGQRLGAVVFVFDDATALAQPRVVDRLRRLNGARAMVCLRRDGVVDPPSDVPEAVDVIRRLDARASLDAAIAGFLEAFGLPPAGAFMVGMRHEDCAAAERQRLALFKWAASYFAASA